MGRSTIKIKKIKYSLEDPSFSEAIYAWSNMLFANTVISWNIWIPEKSLVRQLVIRPQFIQSIYHWVRMCTSPDALKHKQLKGTLNTEKPDSTVNRAGTESSHNLLRRRAQESVKQKNWKKFKKYWNYSIIQSGEAGECYCNS